jgi:nucleoside-diphosphate-sugar epimerase
MSTSLSPASPALVTGGCGFVGRHVAQRLLRERRDVWLIDDLSTGQHPDRWLPAEWLRRASRSGAWTVYEGPSRVVFLEGDARSFFDGRAPDGGEAPPTFGDVVHLAAVVGGRVKIDGNPIAVAIDLAMDACMYNWAIQARPRRILYASSSAAYPVDLQGRDGATALKESDIEFGGRLGQPDMTYGWSKLTGEYLGRLAAAHYGLHVACVRPFSGYGEDQDESYPVPAIAARAARREDPLVVWGSGLQGRDFVHIDDCVEAMFRVLDRVSDGSAVNIGSGRLTTFLQVAALFAEIEGYAPQIRPLADKPVGVHTRFADTTRSRELLQWEPSITIRQGFERVLRRARERRADAVPQ